MFLPAMCLLSSALLLSSAWAQPPRCRVLCANGSTEDACQRCRLRIPMRFGKRDSSGVALFQQPGDRRVRSFIVDRDVVDDEADGSDVYPPASDVFASPAMSDHYGFLLRAIRRRRSDYEDAVPFQ